jgi:hypothetical protein
MMESTAIFLIIVALFLLVIIIGFLSLLIYKLLKQQTISTNSSVIKSSIEPNLPDAIRSQIHPGINERLLELKKIKPTRSDLFCPNHSDEPGEANCAICDRLFCKTCIKPFKTMHFCKEHLPLIMKHDWDEVLTIKTSTSDPEQGVRLFDVKKNIFRDDDIPTYIETHYKINVDQDYIETYLVLFAIKERITTVREKFEDLLSQKNA